VTAQTAMGMRCSNRAAGVRNGVKLEVTGRQTKRGKRAVYSSALALGQAMRVKYRTGILCTRQI